MSSSSKSVEDPKELDPRESADNQTESNSEPSDCDSNPSSRETTPTSSRETTPTRNLAPKVNPLQRKQEGGRVRKLVERFSDSDTTEGSVPVTRRKKSNSQEHKQLPPGGERELRKTMAAQLQANEAVKLWKALLEHFQATLTEAQQALDANAAKGVLMGHSAGIVALETEVDKAWQSVEKFQTHAEVVLDKVNLIVTKNKYNTWCNKIKGHIAALTVTSSSVTASTINVVNPTSFGDLELPDFDGDYTKFNGFESNFRAIINNGNLDDGGKKAFLLRQLKGEARDYIGIDGLANKEYEDVWNDLRNRYGKPWRITRAAVKKLMDIKDPSDDPKDISRYWNQISEVCKVSERLELTASSIILNMGLLKLPVDFRSKMDEKIKPLSKKYILTREIVAEPFNDVIAGELEKPNNIVATLGFNTIPHQAPSQPNVPVPKLNQKNGRKKLFMCLLCGRQQRGHKTWQCPTYNTGILAQERMKSLGRCQHCAVVASEHGVECSHRAHCSVHPTQRHNFWLCTNYLNGTYKGSQPQQPLQQYAHPQSQQYPHQPPQQQYQYQQLYPQQGAYGHGQPPQWQQSQGNGVPAK